MRFLSVCSGIEAASQAWGPLGWEAVAFSEIEPFPCAVLKHHYPNTPNWGDMNKYKDWPDVSIDLLCGGTPCQSFSVAGLRKGLDDPRGNLMLTFGAIAAKYRPQWLVWENVPGVLSSNEGRDFGSFLGLLGVLGYGFTYRVLDAQYFGLAQRRRRVFVVGCLGDWRSAAAVLFERHSLQGHPAPSRKARQEVAGTIEASVGRSRGAGTPVAALTVTGQSQEAFGGNNTSGAIEVATALRAKGTFHYDFESETFLTCSDHGEGVDSWDDAAGVEAPSAALAYGIRTANTSSNGWGVQEEVTHTLDRAMGIAVAALPFDTTQITSASNYSNPKEGDPCHPLAASAHAPCIAFPERMSGTQCASTEELAPSMGAANPTAVAVTSNKGRPQYQVRRLTPKECARLQGFPDTFLDISFHRKPALDGPKYKALGNSWAVPNVAWIGRRIEAVEAIRKSQKSVAA